MRRQQRRFFGAGYECTTARQVALFGVRSTKKEVWTMSTLFTPDCLVQPPDWPGFRMFRPLPSVCVPENPARVPPRAQHDPSSEGSFALTYVHSRWSGPSEGCRGVCRLSPGRRWPVHLWGRGSRFVAGGASAGSVLGLWVPLLVRPVGRGWPTPLHGCEG